MNTLHPLDPGDIAALRTAFDEGRSDPVRYVESLLDRIDKVEGAVQAWISIDRSGALRQAERCRDELRSGRRLGPLHGIPVAIKDVIDVAGWPTRAGSRSRATIAPARRDGECVSALRTAGAIILGKTHTTEYAYFDGPPPTRNPWNLGHTPGGSSAGSAAAVAAGMVPASLGTQTAGSVVRPAAYCGIAAFKPSSQSLSADGMVPLAPAFDTLGWFGYRMRDVAAVGAALDPQRFTPSVRQDRARIGLLQGPLFRDASTTVGDAMAQAARALDDAGYCVVRVDSPAPLQDLMAAHKTILEFELSRLHGELASRCPELLTPGWLAALRRGLATGEEAHLEARCALQEARNRCWAAWQELDLLLVPAAPEVAPAGMPTGDPRYIIPITALGGPIATIPLCVSASGLPVGAMLCGRPGADGTALGDALAIAALVELGRSPA